MDYKKYLPGQPLTYLLLLVLVSCKVDKPKAQAAPKPSYQNPVFNHDFPDPNLVKANDGFYYAYSTQADWRTQNMGGPYTTPILRSKNLVDWQFVGDAFMKKPDWKSAGGIWAPDASFHNNQFYIYYSFSTWGDPNPGIGVATSDTPEGPFTDHGKVFLSSEVGVPNSIDPVFFEDEGHSYLVWGSFHGIYGIELSADGLQTTGSKFQIAGKDFEGSYIYKRGNYYYYFGSSGSCCEGAKSTYHVRVGRSLNFKGPYIDKDGKSLLQDGGTLLLEKDSGSEGFVGPGHNGDIVTDDDGQTWMIYHAFNKKNTSGRLMLLDKITWTNDWPEIENNQPTYQKTAAPVFH